MQLLVMNEYLAIPFFIVTTIVSSIQGGPLGTSFLYRIELSANNANLKCPSLRISKLVKPEPEFLSKCGSFELATLRTHVTEENLDTALCLLYYNNFLNLCNASNNYPNNTSEKPDFAVEKLESKLEEVCESLKNNIYLGELKPGIEVLQKAFDNEKCKRYCTDLDDNVKLVCVYSAYMAESTKKLYAQTPISNADSKSNKGKKPKLTEAAIKAQATEHGLGHVPKAEIKETHENPQIQANDANAPVAEQPGVAYDKNIDMSGNTDVKNGDALGNEGSPNAQKVEVHKDAVGHTDEQNVPLSSSDHFGITKQTNEQQPLLISKESPDTVVKPQDEAVPGIKSTSENTNNQQMQNEPPNPADTQAVNEVTSTSNSNNHQNNDKQLPVIVKDEPVQVSLAQDQNKDNLKGSVAGKNEEEIKAQQMHTPEDTKEQQEEKDKKIQQDNQGDVAAKDEGGGMENLQDPNEQMESQEDQDGDIAIGNDVDTEDTFNELETKPIGVLTKPIEKSKPREIDEDGSSFAVNYQNQNIDDSESYFFSYFMMVCIMFICGYVAYHNKQKILALVVEGRKGRRPSRTRRPNSANYRKLDSNLEEAVTSSCNKNATQVIY